MESGKTSTDIYVTLSYSPLGLVGAKATGFQDNGICVDTGAIRLPFYSEVEVTLSYREGNRLQVHRVIAQVTDRNSEGTRLTFQEPEPETARALAQLQIRYGMTALEGVA